LTKLDLKLDFSRAVGLDLKLRPDVASASAIGADALLINRNMLYDIEIEEDAWAGLRACRIHIPATRNLGRAPALASYAVHDKQKIKVVGDDLI
jgi:hypothetical protein